MRDKMAERVTNFTPLGIRFWDAVLDKQVSDHLLVKAYPAAGFKPVINAFRTASGIYAFQGLPGMQEVEKDDSDGVPAVPSSGKKSFSIEVKDELERFLPMVFKVELPLPELGVYLYGGATSVTGSPPLSSAENPPGFYLFSAPTRTVSPGLAVIYAMLKEESTGNPAAHAVIETQVDGEDTSTNQWYGVADEKGCICVLLPYPSIKVSLSNSPPESTTELLKDKQWQLTFRVRYAPAELTYPFNRNDIKIPYLDSILKQSSGVIWTGEPGGPVSDWTEMLTFGKELTLKTQGEEKHVLLIDAAASP
jgi:hypothetical protein